MAISHLRRNKSPRYPNEPIRKANLDKTGFASDFRGMDQEGIDDERGDLGSPTLAENSSRMGRPDF
jgi:hypothetical protein